MIQPTIEYPKIKIWDNLIEDYFLHTLDLQTNELKMTFNNTGGEIKKWPHDPDRSYKLWGNTLFKRINQNRIINNLPEDIENLYYFILDNLIPHNVILQYSTINGQTIGLDGGIHQDIDYTNIGLNSDKRGKEYTIMIFINHKWEKEWGGEFQVFTQQKDQFKLLHNIEYIPGRILFFDGILPHRGLAPKIPYLLRKSLVFKVNIID